jgi:hypothetical protein
MAADGSATIAIRHPSREARHRWYAPPMQTGMRWIARAAVSFSILVSGCGGDCPAGETRCGDVCVSLETDDANCGACGVGCGDSTCVAGACVGACGATEVVCGARCCPRETGCDATGTTCAPADAGPDGGPADTYRPPPPCPTAVPVEGEACEARDQRCTYQDCPGDGVTRADCQASGWVLTTLPCESYPCDFGAGGMETCTEAELCVARMGGAFLVECVDNPCESGPIEESCACSICGATDECQVDGLSVTCIIQCEPGPCP